MLFVRAHEGRPVKTYSGLIEYLLTKSPHILAVQLDFDGRNVLLHYAPPPAIGADEERVRLLVSPAEPEMKVARGVATKELWRTIV